MQQYRLFIVNSGCWLLTLSQHVSGICMPIFRRKTLVTACGVYFLVVLDVAVCGTVVLCWGCDHCEGCYCTATFTVITPLYRMRQKNTPIWEEHSFEWKVHTVVESTSSNSGVHAVFNVYMACLAEYWVFILEEFIKNGGSPVATQRAFRIRFALGRREAVPDKKTIYRWYQTLDKQDKLWKLWRRRYERKLLPLHLKWFSRSWTTTERLNQFINIQGRQLSDYLFTH